MNFEKPNIPEQKKFPWGKSMLVAAAALGVIGTAKEHVRAEGWKAEAGSVQMGDGVVRSMEQLPENVNHGLVGQQPAESMEVAVTDPVTEGGMLGIEVNGHAGFIQVNEQDFARVHEGDRLHVTYSAEPVGEYEGSGIYRIYEVEIPNRN